MAKTRPLPVEKTAGARHVVKWSFRMSKRRSTLTGLAIKVALLLTYAFCSGSKNLLQWLTLEMVNKVRGLWLGSSLDKARSFKSNLERDQQFSSVAAEAKEMANNGTLIWKVRSHAWCQLSKSMWTKESVKETQQLPPESPNVIYCPVQVHQSLKPLAVDKRPLKENRKTLVKSPNYFLPSSGYPKRLNKDKEMQGKNCCLNTWIFLGQELLRRGFRAAFHELFENVPDGTELHKLLCSFLFTNGETTLETEKLKTAFALLHKRRLLQEAASTKTDLFRLWSEDPLAIRTLIAKIGVCDDCGEAIDIQERPNLVKSEFMELTGRAEAVKFSHECKNCKKEMEHSITYILSSNILYIDAEDAQEDSENIEEVLADWPNTVNLPGDNPFQLIAAPTEEWYSPCRGHQFATRREEDGSVNSIDDATTDRWEEPFRCTGLPHNVTGGLYGRLEAATNRSSTCPASSSFPTLLGGGGGGSSMNGMTSTPSSTSAFTLWTHQDASRTLPNSVDRPASSTLAPTPDATTPSLVSHHHSDASLRLLHAATPSTTALESTPATAAAFTLWSSHYDLRSSRRPGISSSSASSSNSSPPSSHTKRAATAHSSIGPLANSTMSDSESATDAIPRKRQHRG